MSPDALWQTVQGYVSQGGGVMIPLVLSVFALYYALGYRAHLLRRGTKSRDLRALLRSRRGDPSGPVGGLIPEAIAAAHAASEGPAKTLPMRLDDALAPVSERLDRFGPLARTIVVLAPLLGLLGTVSGMIEMFDSLGSQTFYAQHGGIAHGIAKALFTTQFGLAIAIPGYFAVRLLDRRQTLLVGELDQLKTVLCQEASR